MGCSDGSEAGRLAILWNTSSASFLGGVGGDETEEAAGLVGSAGASPTVMSRAFWQLGRIQERGRGFLTVWWMVLMLVVMQRDRNGRRREHRKMKLRRRHEVIHRAPGGPGGGPGSGNSRGPSATSTKVVRLAQPYGPGAESALGIPTESPSGARLRKRRSSVDGTKTLK